ncbi:MAG TPA: peroxiredoxin [Methanoregulaceae archaeon]|nr:peroxiredoxin [Methanoregulaceae archaeon]
MPQEPADPYEGREAPPFCLPDSEGKETCLLDFRGKWVVLYFYPKDNTPGCTLEAMQFSQAMEEFSHLGAQVIGISQDSPESHLKFIDRHDLTVLLLSDLNHEVLKLYDAWRPKTIFGKEFLGTVRTTFLINPDGIIAEVWRNVSVKGHAEAVRLALLANQERKVPV